MLVIPNGYELDRFRPDPDARARVRAEAGIPDDAPVVGLVARFHPQKDHRTFFEAAEQVARRFPDVHFLLCGNGLSWENPEVTAMTERAGIAERSHLLGYRADVPAVQASLDIACLCSQGGEGFPNTVAEAMACGVPCVVSDVGDAATIVGEIGRVVPIGDAASLARGIGELLCLDGEERLRLGQRARQRIVERYDFGQFMARYEALYDQLAEAGRSGEWAFGLSER
jgi:glycosyltransferase involved in cell wall biosynthesis